MRRQIFFFHMVTLILALLTLLTVSGGVLHLVFRAYQDQAVPAADSRSDQVQSTLASWPEEARDWWELDQSLAKLDYRLAVEQNHQVVYSSLNRFQEDLYNRIFANASWPESGTLSLQDQGIFIVGRRCGDAVLVAMMEPQTPEMFGQQRPQNEAALISFSVIGLAAIAIIGVLSFLFTQYQVRRILKPVNAIIQAAGRVERGDLSTPLDCKGPDEFSSVYAAFEHMRRHLLEEQKKSARYEQARTDLVSGISHDLRTPLTAISGAASVLLSSEEIASSERSASLVRDIKSDADSLSAMVENLLSITKIRDGVMPLNKQEEMLEEVAGDALLTMRRRFPDCPIALELSDDILYLPMEPMLIKQVIVNLLENAIRHSGDREHIRLRLFRQEDWAVVEVRDRGRGISPEVSQAVQLGRPLEDNLSGDSSRGMGIGLSVCQSIIKAHDGFFAAGNDPEGGAVFRFGLPMEEIKDE